MTGKQTKVASPAASETPMYRQSLIPGGGVAPRRTSRVRPPALPAAKDSTVTPKRSSRYLTPLPRSSECQAWLTRPAARLADSVFRAGPAVAERSRAGCLAELKSSEYEPL
jgi:hypothetical protein